MAGCWCMAPGSPSCSPSGRWGQRQGLRAMGQEVGAAYTTIDPGVTRCPVVPRSAPEGGCVRQTATGRGTATHNVTSFGASRECPSVVYLLYPASSATPASASPDSPAVVILEMKQPRGVTAFSLQSQGLRTYLWPTHLGVDTYLR